MKRIIILILLFSSLFMLSSCSNDEVKLEDGEYIYAALTSSVITSYVKKDEKIQIKNGNLIINNVSYKLKKCVIDKEKINSKNVTGVILFDRVGYKYNQDIVQSKDTIHGYFAKSNNNNINTVYYLFDFNGKSFLYIYRQYELSSSKIKDLESFVRINDESPDKLLNECLNEEENAYFTIHPKNHFFTYYNNVSIKNYFKNAILKINDWKTISDSEYEKIKDSQNKIIISNYNYPHDFDVIIDDNKLYFISGYKLNDMPIIKYYSEEVEAIEKMNKIINLSDENYFASNVLSECYDETKISYSFQEDAVKAFINRFADFTDYFNDGTLFTASVEDCLKLEDKEGYFLKFNGVKILYYFNDNPETIEYRNEFGEVVDTITLLYEDDYPYFYYNYFEIMKVCTITDAYSLCNIDENDLKSLNEYMKDK